MKKTTAREMADDYMNVQETANVADIGEKIVKYRKANGMSQTYLASQIGISNQGLLKIEKGHTYPRADTLKKILDALCITPNQLFGTEEMDEENLNLLARVRRMSE